MCICTVFTLHIAIQTRTSSVSRPILDGDDNNIIIIDDDDIDYSNPLYTSTTLVGSIL